MFTDLLNRSFDYGKKVNMSISVLTILPFEIRDVLFIITFFVVDNLWEFIDLGVLVEDIIPKMGGKYSFYLQTP